MLASLMTSFCFIRVILTTSLSYALQFTFYCITGWQIPKIDHTDWLIWEYCIELISLYPHIVQIKATDKLILNQLYKSSGIKPNHYYSTHVNKCVQNYGLLYNFWTFLYKWLNKVLKLYKTNNHSHRNLKTTFFHDFQKTWHISWLIYCPIPHSLKLNY